MENYSVCWGIVEYGSGNSRRVGETLSYDQRFNLRVVVAAAAVAEQQLLLLTGNGGLVVYMIGQVRLGSSATSEMELAQNPLSDSIRQK